jgi:hypothetical protein
MFPYLAVQYTQQRGFTWLISIQVLIVIVSDVRDIHELRATQAKVIVCNLVHEYVYAVADIAFKWSAAILKGLQIHLKAYF